MKFKKSKLYQWCNRATAKIRHKPDRERVYEELFSHMEERYESFIAHGDDDETAQNKTVEAMGDADETAVYLGALHRPTEGRLLIFSRILLVVAIYCFISYGVSLLARLPYQPNYWDDWPYTVTESGDYKRIEVYSADSTDYEDGVFFKVTQAVEWEYHNKRHLHVKVETINLWPIEYDWSYFWAEDSLGNYYANRFAYDARSVNAIDSISHNRTGPFTCVYSFVIRSFISQEAEWLDLCYKQEGRDIVLRVDLNGGEAN